MQGRPAEQQPHRCAHGHDVGTDIDRVGDEQQHDDHVQQGECLRMPAANPWPVTQPIRAQIIWMATISGKVSQIVHNSP